MMMTVKVMLLLTLPALALACARPHPRVAIVGEDGRCWKIYIAEGVQVEGGYPLTAVEVECDADK